MSLHQTPQYHRKAVVRQDPKKEVTKLKQQPGKDISISGSAALVRSLLRDGFLDELRLMVHPVGVGGGKCLFEDGGDQRALELVDSKTFSTGVLYLTYQPAQS
jgi:dihydrofolate reductase